MTQQHDNFNRGALFKNDRRNTDRSPEYTGTININGVEYWLSAWVKEGRNGKFLSLSCQEKEVKPARGGQDMAASGRNSQRQPDRERDNRRDDHHQDAGRHGINEDDLPF